MAEFKCGVGKPFISPLAAEASGVRVGFDLIGRNNKSKIPF